MSLLIIFLLVALGVSFLCSILEAVILSVTPSYIHSAVQRGSRAGLRLERLKDQIERPLAAILSLNTIAHTVGAAGVGAQAALVFGEAYFGVISAVLTLLILIFSEIIPKTLGARFWRVLAPASASACLGIIVLVYPLVILSEWVGRIIGGKHSSGSVDRDEVRALASIGHAEGIFTASESEIIAHLARSGKRTARDILTPRTAVRCAPDEWPLQRLLDEADILRFTRIPLYRESIDSIDGYVLKSELLEKIARGQGSIPVGQIRRELPAVVETKPLSALFDFFIRRREPIALVVDEFGGVAGIVTLEDVIENVLGREILDETDTTEDMRTPISHQTGTE